jgi:hypothetical protein
MTPMWIHHGEGLRLSRLQQGSSHLRFPAFEVRVSLTDPGFDEPEKLVGFLQQFFRFGIGRYVSVFVVDSIPLKATGIEIISVWSGRFAKLRCTQSRNGDRPTRL